MYLDENTYDTGSDLLERKDGVWVPTGCDEHNPAVHTHPRDFGLRFRSSRVYKGVREGRHDYARVGRTPEETLRMSKYLMSVTTFLGEFEEPFNDIEVATKMVNKPGFPFKEPRHKKYIPLLEGQARKDWVGLLAKYWEEERNDASMKGTRMHAVLEQYALAMIALGKGPQQEEKDLVYKEFATDKRVKQGVQFLLDIYERERLVVYRAEWLIYTDDEFDIPGGVDLVMCSEEEFNSGNVQNVVVVDWKGSKAIKAINTWQTMKPPLQALQQCNYNKYQLQLLTYKKIFMDYYGLNVVKNYIVVCHDNRDTYMALLVGRLDRAVLEIFMVRKEQLIKLRQRDLAEARDLAEMRDAEEDANNRKAEVDNVRGLNEDQPEVNKNL